MKLSKKIIALCTAAVSALSISTFSVNAVYIFSLDPNLNPISWVRDGYVEIDEHVEGASPYKVYQKIGEYGSDLMNLYCKFNSTSLHITADGYDTYLEIYEQYEEELDFDYYAVRESDTGYSISMHDYLDENGVYSVDASDYISKKNLLIAFCNELKEAGIVTSANYAPTRSNPEYGYHCGNIEVTNVPENETDALQEIVSAYDEDAVVTAEETDETIDYNIFPVEDILACWDIIDEIEAAYTDATATSIGYFLEDSTITVDTETIDLLTAEPDAEVDTDTDTDAAADTETDIEVDTATDTTETVTATAEDVEEAVETILTYLYGDPDNDGKVTIQDAYRTLLYYAEVSAGVENVAFDPAGDAQAEAAAYQAADVDGDESITMHDAYLILQYYATESAGGTPSWET